MGAHIAERSLLLGCLVALVIPAHSLKCHSCVGSDGGCSPTQVTCPGENDKCSTTAVYIDSFPCKVQKVFKGCITSSARSEKISISPNDRITLSLQQKLCDFDLCNTKEISGPNKTPNDLYCHSCISPGTTCNSDSMKTMRCMGEQNQCVDMKVIGSFGDIADVNLKGCGQIPSCTKKLVFSSQTSSVSVQCCDGNFCNGDTDSESEDKTPNGIQCYSCNTLDGSSCATESVIKAQCYGALTSCLEIAGTYVKDGQTIPTVIKGCATPSICEIPILPLLQKLGTPTVKCCNGTLCNSQFSESGLQASGYLPIGNVSPGTGIQNRPSSDATSGGNSVKTDHTTTKYGTNSHSNNGYPNPNINSYNEFSNSDSVYNPNFPAEVDQGTPYNGLSVANPNLVSGSNIFPNVEETTDNDNILIEMFSECSSIMHAPPIFPDFPTYGEDSFYPNSNYNHDMNFPDNNEYDSYDNGGFTEIAYTDIDFPNSNDISNSENAGFTDIVYTDLDWNEDPSNTPTVAPDNVSPNGHDSVGSSANNPDTILLTNNNETGEYSTNTVNNGSNVNVQGNNSNVQNLASTTSKPPNSDINLNISGYGTNIYNTDTANNNASGNNISSPINYTSGENNLSVLSPGPSTLGGEGASNYTNNSTTDSSFIPDAPPTFPDFPSYGDDSIVSNSNSDNDINFPYNNENNSYDYGGFTEIAYTDIDFPNSNDYNNYENAGFTDIVYTDLDWNEDPSNTPTVAPDSASPNSHDSVGSSAYNPDTILSANNETGENSTNTVNNGSIVNVQGNNGNVQNLKSTTPQTHNSDPNHQISAYATNIHNIGPANNNGSENNVSSPVHYSSGANNLSVLSSGPSTPGGNVLSNYDNNSTGDGSSLPDAPPTFPDSNSYGEDSSFPNSNSDNDMNFPYNNENNSYDYGGFTEIAYTDLDFPNNNDYNSYENAGFTDIVYTDVDWNEDPSNSPTVAPISVGPSSHDSVGSSAYNPDTILLANNNETGEYSTNPVNNGSNVNVQGNNSNVQNLSPTTPKSPNSGTNQHTSVNGTNMYNNTGTHNQNDSENNVSNPNHYSSGENNLSVLSSGPPPLGGENISNYTNPSTTESSFIPDAPPTFPDSNSYGEDSSFPNSNSDNDVNFPYNNENNSYDYGGFTEIAYTDIDFPNSNDYNNYENAGFTDIVYTDVDWNEDPSNSPTVAPISVGTSSHDSVGSSAYNPDTILLANNNTGEYPTNTVNNGSNVNVQENNSNVQNLNPTTPKSPNSDTNQQITAYGTNMYNNTGTHNKNDSENNVSSPSPYSSGENNLSVVSSGPPPLGGESISNYTNPSTTESSFIPDAPPTFPDSNSYGEDSSFPNSNSDNDINFPYNNENNSYDYGGFTEIAYTDIDFPNNNDFNNYDSGMEDPSNSPTVVPVSVTPNSHDSFGSSGSDTYNPDTILLANSNETGGYSTNTVNNGSNTNVQVVNGSMQNLNPTPPKPLNSDSNQQISEYGTNFNTVGPANNNVSENNVSTPIHYSSGETNLSVISPGPSTLGGESISNYSNHNTSDGSFIPDATPTFPDFTSYEEDSFVSNSNYDHNMNFPNNNDYSNYDNGGFTEIANTDLDFPNSNDFNNYENAGFTDVGYTDVDWNEDPSNSPTVAPDSVGPTSHGSVGNSGSDTYKPNTILSANNNETGGFSADTVKGKHQNSGIKQHISGHGANIFNTGIANINGSGNYISSSGNNTAGSGNSSNSDSSGSSSLDGYINSENGTGITNEWNNSNNYSNQNTTMPVGYTNITGNNHSSPPNGSSSNETGLSSTWHDTVVYNSPENNGSSTTHNGIGVINGGGNSSNSNMSENVGYTNIPGNNDSTSSYTSSGNGTGMANMTNPVGYTNITGNNHSSPPNGSSSNETGLSSTWHDTVVNNSPENNGSSTTYNGIGVINGGGNSSNSNITEHVGYTNIPGNNDSTTSNTSSSNGTGIPVGYTNITGNNHSSPPNVSSSNTGMTNEFSNSYSSYPNMSVPGGYTNMFGSNDSSTSDGSSGNATGVDNSNSSIHSMPGYGNFSGSNDSSTSHASSGNENGNTNNSSNHNIDVPEGYTPGNNDSSHSYGSPGHGTEINNGNSSSNHSMLVPGANEIAPGGNGSSTSYTSSNNVTGISNEWLITNGSYHNMAPPSGDYGSFNSNGSSHSSDSNNNSNFGPSSGNDSYFGGSWDSIESYLNHISSGANNNGSNHNISSWMHEMLPEGSSYNNQTAWMFGSNYDPNMMPNNNNNDSSSYYNYIQNFLSKLNESIHSNDSTKINEWIQNNSFFPNLMPPSVNNGSGPSAYNVNSMFNKSLSDYFKNLGMSWNNSNIYNMPSLIPNLLSPGSPNNNGSTNTHGFIWGSGSNGQPNNPNGMNSEDHGYGSTNGNGDSSYVMPPGGNNPGAGSNIGHESINNNSYNSNMMVPGEGNGGSSYGVASTDANGNAYNTNLLGHGTDVLVPGRSTNDSTSDSASNGSGSKNDTMPNSATSLWTKSGHFVIFSALALLVLN